MTAEKKTEAGVKSATAAGSTRKPWTPKSTVQVVLEQIGRQEKKVAELQRELDTEKATLTKLLQAKKVLEAT
jgi:hypothetical protein